MSYTVPEPHKVRALRIPADGSHPHLITLETLIIEPDPPPKPVSYAALLLQLQEEEDRHIPNLFVFWGARGLKSRFYFQIEYGVKECEKLDGHYYVYRTSESTGLQRNKILSNCKEEFHGDAFVFRAVDYKWNNETDHGDVVRYLDELRIAFLYPDFADVEDDILLCDIIAEIARILRHNAGCDDEETQSNTESISDGEVRTSAEAGDEPGLASTASSSSRGPAELQEKESESKDRDLP